MKKELFETQQWILGHKSPEDCIMLADMYIEMYNRTPSNFRVPQEHKKLDPVIKQFHDKPSEFVKFVRDIRDAATKEQYSGVHELFRRVQSRYVQQERRRRLSEGIALIEKSINKRFSFGQKQSVAVWLEQYWGKERTAVLEDARRTCGNVRLSTDERADICEVFWAGIDADLKNDIVPTPPEIVYGKLASLESHKPNSV